MKTRAPLRHALLLSLLLPPAALAAEPVNAWQGSRTAVTVAHLQPAMKGGSGYGDKYTFNGEFGDRGSLYFSLTISNLGLGDHKMEAKGRLTLDGKTYNWKRNLSSSEWSRAKDGFKISAGPATLSGTPDHLVLEAIADGAALRFDCKPIARPWRPRNGQIQYGSDRKISDYTVFPLLEVTGSVMLDGTITEVSGKGYGSHSWSELGIYDQARWAMEFRGVDLAADTTLYVRELGLHRDYGGGRIAYLLVTRGKDILIESFDYELTPTALHTDEQHDNKYQVPESFTLLGKDAEEPEKRMFRGKITKRKLRKRRDLLASMNAAMRAIVGRVSKPVTYEYDSDYLVEVRHPGGTERLKGVGRYEITHFNR